MKKATTNKTEMTTAKFMAYESVRRSGLTNMFDVAQVIHLAKQFSGVELSREDVKDIIANYAEYRDIATEKYRDMG